MIIDLYTDSHLYCNTCTYFHSHIKLKLIIWCFNTNCYLRKINHIEPFGLNKVSDDADVKCIISAPGWGHYKDNQVVSPQTRGFSRYSCYLLVLGNTPHSQIVLSSPREIADTWYYSLGWGFFTWAYLLIIAHLSLMYLFIYSII